MEKSKMREILEMFEGAGFVVTSLRDAKIENCHCQKQTFKAPKPLLEFLLLSFFYPPGLIAPSYEGLVC